MHTHIYVYFCLYQSLSVCLYEKDDCPNCGAFLLETQLTGKFGDRTKSPARDVVAIPLTAPLTQLFFGFSMSPLSELRLFSPEEMHRSTFGFPEYPRDVLDTLICGTNVHVFSKVTLD